MVCAENGKGPGGKGKTVAKEGEKRPARHTKRG